MQIIRARYTILRWKLGFSHNHINLRNSQYINSHSVEYLFLAPEGMKKKNSSHNTTPLRFAYSFMSYISNSNIRIDLNCRLFLCTKEATSFFFIKKEGL